MNQNKIICAIYDAKSKTYQGYMVLDNETQAVRSFQMACQNNEVFKKWPEDFEMHKLGDITEATVTENFKNIAKATYYVDKPIRFDRPANNETTKKSKKSKK